MFVQSEDEPEAIEIGSAAHAELQEQIVYHDTNPGTVHDHAEGQTATTYDNGTINTDLAKFLRRPTRISSINWSVGNLSITTPIATINPWTLLLSNSVIKRKLENYAYFRGKLHLKFVVNGTQFHYGLLRPTYEYLKNTYSTRIRTNVTTEIPLLIPNSQLPGVEIEPSSNKGGEMVLPMIWNREWLPLQQLANANALGELRYMVFSPLRIAASGVTDNVTVTTYAWFEDVEVSGSTARLVMQARDEYADLGIISAPASKIGNIAKMLTNVPIIGRFAKATEIGATAVASVAKLFGFSNVPNISDVHAFVPHGVSNLATAEISIPYQKLTLNPKQELSIDSSALHGAEPEDPLIISNMVKRKSFFAKTTWTGTNIPGDILFQSVVNPKIAGNVPILDGSSVVKGYRVYHTPLSFATSFFDQWRGDIIFTIKVIKSKFHKGRLKVTWDPRSTGAATVPQANEVYNVIIDLGEEQDYKIKIPYHSAYGLLRTRNETDVTFVSGGAISSDDIYDNGVMQISVLTELVSPLSTADLEILMYVEGADNFFCLNPKDTVDGTVFAIQSNDEVYTDFGEKVITPDHLDLKYCGEPIGSLRMLLRRNTLLDVIQCPDSAANQAVKWRKSFSYFPPMEGYDPTGFDTADTQLVAGTAPYHFGRTTPISIVICCFAGFSGSFNYNFTLDTSQDIHNSVQVYRRTAAPPGDEWGQGSTSSIDTSSTQSFRHRVFTNNTDYGSGVVNMQPAMNGSLSVVLPWMNHTSFAFPNPGGALRNQAAGFYDNQTQNCLSFRFLGTQTSAQGSVRRTRLTTYVGAGVDFNVVQFVCIPTMDYYNVRPNA